MKKKLLFSFILFISFFVSTKVYAYGPEIELYLSDYLVDSCNYDACDFNNVSFDEIRYSYPQISIPANYRFRFRTYINIYSSNASSINSNSNFSCTMWWNDSELGINSEYGDARTSYIDSANSGSAKSQVYFAYNRWFRYDQSNSRFQARCKWNTSYRTTRVNVTYTLNNLGQENHDSSGGSTNAGNTNDTNQIIANDNQNTQNIINNQNNNTQQIIGAQEDTTDAINDLNDTLQETEIDDETIGDKVGEIQQISETPITDLLTMPITLLQKYYTGITGSCSPYNLGSLFNHNLTLPCINGQQLLGSTIWTIIDGLFVIFMVYNIGMMVVSFFESITSLNDTFDSMYQPQHATYHPKHGGDK